MDETVSEPAREAVLTRAETAVSDLITLPLDGCTDEDILTLCGGWNA